MTLLQTISSSLHSLVSYLVEIPAAFTRRGYTRTTLYSIVGIGATLFIVCMSLWKILGVVNRQSRGEAPRQSSVEQEIVGEGQGQDFEESAVRSAKRRKKPASSHASQDHASNNSRSVQTPRPTVFTSTSELRSPFSCVLSDAILGNTYLSESPTLERHMRTQEEYSLGPLPLEVLLMIFKFVSLQGETFPGHFQLSTLLSLRQVCKRWKEIIEGAKELWVTLHPPLTNTKCGASVEWYIGVTEELSRTGKGFDLVVLELLGEPHSRLFKHLIKLAISSVAVKVISRTDTGMSSLLVGTPTRRRPSDGPPMENLRKLEWTMKNHCFTNQLPQSLSLPWTSLSQLPWARLTHVTLEVSMTLQDCDFIFDQALLVEHLNLRDVSDDPSPTSTESSIERNIRSRMHTLKIVSAVSISSLLQKYDLPQLRHVEFEFTGVNSALDLPHAVIPWREFTHVSLSCIFTVDLTENIIVQLHSVEVLVLKGQLPGDDAAWTLSHTIASLRSFTLVPTADAAAPRLMSHFIEHVFPTSIETINAPLVSDTFTQLIVRPFNSLRTINTKNHAISPNEFLSFLDCSNHLMEGSFKVHDYYYDNVPSPTTPSFPALPHKIFCNIVKLELHLDYQHTEAGTSLDALYLPKLSSLKFRASRKSSAYFFQLLTRSGCMLSNLSLDLPRAASTRSSKLLELMGSTLAFLESLEINSDDKSELGETLWTSLTHTDMGTSPTQCICPRLERLIVAPCGDSESFYRMVDSRSNFPNGCGCGLRKLKHVDAVLDDTPTRCSDFMQQLKAKNIECKAGSYSQF